MFLLQNLRAKAESLNSMKLTKPKTLVTEREVYDYIRQENGMIRLRRAFEISDGKLSPELKFYFSNYCNRHSATVFVFFSSFSAFRRNNELLPSNMAKDERFRTLMKTSAKEAVVNSFRNFSIFAVTFALTETIAIYRNKTTPLEYSLVGALLVGALSGIKYDQKIPELPKTIANNLKVPLKPTTRMVAIRNGTLSGAVIGLFMGFVFTYLARMSGFAQEKRHMWNVLRKLQEEKEKESELHQWSDSKEELVN